MTHLQKGFASQATKHQNFLQTVTYHFYRLWHTSSASYIAAPHNFHRQWHKTPYKECVNVCMCPSSWVSPISIFSGDDQRSYTSTMEILRDVRVMHHGPDLTEVCEYSWFIKTRTKQSHIPGSTQIFVQFSTSWQEHPTFVYWITWHS